MGIVCDERCLNNMESSTIVDYHHHKLEDIDQYKHAIIVVAPETDWMLNHFIQETNMPPKSQSDQESSQAFQGTISYCLSKRHSRD